MFRPSQLLVPLAFLLIRHHNERGLIILLTGFQDFEPSPSSCPGLEYLDIPASTDMRYNHQDSNTSPLTLESAAQPSPVLNLYAPGPTSLFNATPSYQPDAGGSFYTSGSHIFPTSLDVRPRLGSSSSSTTGMAHAHRSTALPHPGAQNSIRDIYSAGTPSFRRGPEHTPRSPSFPGSIRRHPISPTPSPNLGFTAPIRMDATYGSKSQQTIPPLQPMTPFGSLSYTEGGAQIKVDINGVIDKGFFQAEGEWTCYRRNYFSCVCSYNLTPYYPTAAIQYTQTGSSQTYAVYGFAMCISAVVADNDGHTIELVQHTPKRDKGPIAPPDKVRLNPKLPQAQSHPLAHFGTEMGMAGSSRVYDQGYGQQQQGSCPTEHTFERIQFKQATANNGKRRAAQQYYHLVVELYADIATQGNGDQYIKIASRKSAKMIVRGRSPGHYQAERRGSTSSGPGGSAGSLGSYGPSSGMGGDYTGSGVGMLPGPFATAYDTRSGTHYRAHHHGLPTEPMLSADDTRTISETKDYEYLPTPIYEGQDPRNTVEMFSHQRSDHQTTLPHMATGVDLTSKVKPDYDAALPSLSYPGNSYLARGCGRFEGKSTSGGYYPVVIPPGTSGMSMT
ncbi:NDT80/PhoG like DNA-binding family protein [Pleurostoma richardsiae]|uniref:NDT80/PhoG like DNA-binding family protein n=1 Tax=Pleurostoma richardsiae TaxID=41990 RepID=A0AA38RES2_9PEZI|nr:NDT80/PhoG like DNA-binding family protein [Pleurostoma richardsiae]